MFSNKGNYEKDIVQLSGLPFEVSYTGENIVAVTICNTHEVVFVNVMTNTIINTVDIGHRCYVFPFLSKAIPIGFRMTFSSLKVQIFFPVKV
jgi:hypothetical protein